MPELPGIFQNHDGKKMQSFGPLSDDGSHLNDTYLGEIVKSEVKATKSGNGGQRLNMQVKIIESKDKCEDYKGRVIFIGLNIKNPNAEAVAISQRELHSICDVVGLEWEELEDSEDLHDISFGFKLKLDKSPGYDDKDVIKKYMTEAEYNES